MKPLPFAFINNSYYFLLGLITGAGFVLMLEVFWK